ERVGGPAAHVKRVVEALLAGLGVGVAAVDDGGADPAAVDELAADADRRRGRGVARQNQARAHGLVVADEQADVGAAAALEPAGGGGSPEARRQAVRVELLDPGRCLDPARREKTNRNAPLRVRFRAHLTSPSVSSRPSIRLRFWTPWPEAPFQMLSIAEK